MNLERLNKWKNYLKTNGGLDYNFGPYSKIYSMTTENILEFLNRCDCLNKDVLTVAGSGDQTFNLLLNGAKNITCFDINPFAFQQVKLKKSAIKCLEYDEFLRFFNISPTKFKLNERDTFLDYALFEKLISDLDNDTFSSFSFLYKFYDYDGVKIFDNVYFKFYYLLEHIKYICNYLDEDNYYKLKDIITYSDYSIKFLESDFSNLPDKICGNKYDLILLSNISDYIHLTYKNDYLKKFYNDIIRLDDSLNECGIIQVGYIYNYSIINGNDFTLKEIRNKVFKTDMFHSMFVTSFDTRIERDDQIITYQKVKG